jgi:hypothetical protein
MQKVEGVEAVRVSLKDGLTILDLKPGNAVTVANLRQIIKNNGFVAKDADIVARGTAADRGFDVSVTHEHLPLNAPPTPVGDEWRIKVKAP